MSDASLFVCCGGLMMPPPPPKNHAIHTQRQFQVRYVVAETARPQHKKLRAAAPPPLQPRFPGRVGPLVWEFEKGEDGRGGC